MDGLGFAGSVGNCEIADNSTMSSFGYDHPTPWDSDDVPLIPRSSIAPERTGNSAKHTQVAVPKPGDVRTWTAKGPVY